MQFNEDKITSVVKDFFSKIHADDFLKQFFKDHDQERIQHHPETFLAQGMGEQKYSNEEIAKAHQGLEMNDEHFDSMIGHFMATLNEQGLSEEDKKTVNEALNSYKKDVLGK